MITQKMTTMLMTMPAKIMHAMTMITAPVPNGPQSDPPQLGHAPASASLSIDDRSDHRVLSTNNLTTDRQSHIGALGVALATIGGVGQYRVRLRRFAISLW